MEQKLIDIYLHVAREDMEESSLQEGKRKDQEWHWKAY